MMRWTWVFGDLGTHDHRSDGILRGARSFRPHARDRRGGGRRVADRLRFPGFAEAARLERTGLALICGFGCLPVVLDLAGRLGPRADGARGSAR